MNTKNTLPKTSKTKYRIPAAILLVLTAILLVLAAACVLFRQNSQPLPFLRESVRLETPLEGGTVLNVQPALSVPTQITKIGEDYFIVDCYHNQILTSDTLDRPLTEWKVMSDQIDKGHTIAGDGTVYLADDTENNRILIFEKKDSSFFLTQTFDDIGIRPHYVVYDEDSGRFYALSSMTGEIYVFARPADSLDVVLEKILSIPELNNIYVRSFTIDGDDLYFISGNRSILRTRKSDLTVLERFPVPDEIAGMIQLTRIQDYFYITVSTDLYGSQDFATMLRVRDLNDLASGSWEDVYKTFIGGGTPYYISAFDGHFYLTEHRIPGHGVWQFDLINNEFSDVIALYP